MLALYGLAGGAALSVWASFTAMVGKPVDAWSYYRISPGVPYWQTDFAFLYSPAAAQAVTPFQALPFEAFVALVRAAELGVALALAGPLLPLVILWPPLVTEVNAANINLLIVGVAVWGLRWPALWSFVLLTKVTPGVGLVWFAVRREWRNLAIALSVTGAIAVASFAYAPRLWFDWVAFMTTLSPSDGAPLWIRVVAAAALVAWGARTDRPWTVVRGGHARHPAALPPDAGNADRPALLRPAASRLPGRRDPRPGPPTGEASAVHAGAVELPARDPRRRPATRRAASPRAVPSATSRSTSAGPVREPAGRGSGRPASALAAASRRAVRRRPATNSPRSVMRAVRARSARSPSDPRTNLLVELGQLAADGGRPIRSARAGEVGERRRDPPGRLEDDAATLVGRDPGQPLAPLAAAPRQEPLERPARAGDAARHERGQDGRRPGDRDDDAALPRPGPDELVARVAHAGRPGIGDQRQVAPAAQVLEQLRAAGAPRSGRGSSRAASVIS